MIKHTDVYSFILLLYICCCNAVAQSSKVSSAQQRLRVSDNERFLVYANGKPFFYLGDTAWELFHRLTLKEAAWYMDNRREKGFTVIQAVALPELDGLHTPNRYNHIPFKNDDPLQPNEDYFKDIDAFVKLASAKGLYIGLLPTWGDKVYKDGWGMGPEIFNPKNAKAYGRFLGNRYKDQANIIWIIGGDRNPRNASDEEVWRSLAEGIVIGVGDKNKVLMTFHPQPNNSGGSAKWFQHDDWLSFNMLQTGHCRNGTNYDQIAYCYALKPAKPVIDGEPLYEDSPVCFDLEKNGYSSAYDVRKLSYWQVFAGAFGHTYGCNAVWQFFAQGHAPVNRPQRYWKEALDLPGAQQMGYLKKLMLSQSPMKRIPDQSLINFHNPKDSSYCSAARAQDGSYAFIYTPTGRSLKVNAGNLKGKSILLKWFNPRNGKYTLPVHVCRKPIISVSPPSGGADLDWVLVITSIGHK